jgi:hypothetical protein
MRKAPRRGRNMNLVLVLSEAVLVIVIDGKFFVV